MENSPSENFRKSGLTLPPAPAPLGVYKPCLIDGKHLYLSGHGPLLPDKTLVKGRIGETMTADEGKSSAAGWVGYARYHRSPCGGLDKVKRVIKVLGMVNCTHDFEKHPHVINGASELFRLVWEEDNGVGVRSAVGMGSLPDNIPVEIEAIFELH